ncbi:unnamed protein product [Linum tenue]|uniref:PHD-type zinc finger plants domain-containing protein n=1 Tax=Linum tenue TaxID=586396 RepID=A0AAV0LCC2_9ROSI|nr:unnamed protein product [Linum tenue]
MADDRHSQQTAGVVVCCMCGDVGFSEKLFRCNKCRHRFQHSYCSNYYNHQLAEPVEQCDWCQSEEMRNATSSRKSQEAGGAGSSNKRSQYSGLKIKQQQQQLDDEIRGPSSPAAGRNHGGLPSPKPSTRRYKLLKDVLC